MSQTVLITGASRGIGASIAEVFASHNYNVVINYIHSKECSEKLCEKLESNYQIQAIAIQADISKEEEIDNLITQAEKKFGTIDCLINNAGICIDTTFEDKTAENFQKILNTNLVGPFLLSKKIGLKMLEQKKGCIINITSTNAIDTYYPESLDYDASKSALISLTNNLAIQFAPFVRVNAVAPGWTKTDMSNGLDDKQIKEETNHILLKRFAEPSEIAKVVYFLASEEASYINKEVIRVDGGWYI